jgi:uncharacterized membrane protein
MKKFTFRDVVVAVLWLAPFIYLATIYGSLPAVIPVHFGPNGKPNGFGPRDTIIFMQLVLSGVCAGLYFLMKYLPLIDPKKQVKYGEDTFNKFSLVIVGFISALSIVIQHAMLNNGLKSDNIIFVLVSLMLVFLGNMMYSVKPNYFVGIRTPWTLENDDTWRITHRLAGKLWTGGGLLLTILMLMIHGTASFIVFISFVLLLALVPVIYSYRYFKQRISRS